MKVFYNNFEKPEIMEKFIWFHNFRFLLFTWLKTLELNSLQIIIKKNKSKELQIIFRKKNILEIIKKGKLRWVYKEKPKHTTILWQYWNRIEYDIYQNNSNINNIQFKVNNKPTHFT